MEWRPWLKKRMSQEGVVGGPLGSRWSFPTNLEICYRIRGSASLLPAALDKSVSSQPCHTHAYQQHCTGFWRFVSRWRRWRPVPIPILSETGNCTDQQYSSRHYEMQYTFLHLFLPLQSVIVLRSPTPGNPDVKHVFCMPLLQGWGINSSTWSCGIITALEEQQPYRFNILLGGYI